MTAFFQSVTFSTDEMPEYDRLHALFLERGLLIRNVAGSCEIASLGEFIAPRRELVTSGRLTQFREVELTGRDTIFGGVAHRVSTYSKSGVQDGRAFEGRGVIVTQFVETPAGWRISSMAWDDERPGLTLDESVFGS